MNGMKTIYPEIRFTPYSDTLVNYVAQQNEQSTETQDTTHCSYWSRSYLASHKS